MLLAVVAAHRAQRGAVQAGGEHVARAVDEVVRLVHEQRQVGPLLEHALDARGRIKRIVVVAHDDVGDLRKRQRELERAYVMAHGRLLHRGAIPHLRAQHLRKGIRQAVEKAARARAVRRVAAPLRAHGADLFARGQLQHARLRAARVKVRRRRKRQRPARRARGQVEDLVRMARGQRLERGEERRRGLAGACRRLRQQPPAVADGDEHIARKQALSLAKRRIGERERAERPVALPPPAQQRLLPARIGLDQRRKCLRERLRLLRLREAVQHAPLPVGIHHVHARAGQAARRAEHVRIAGRLRPVRGQRIRQRRAVPELDLLHTGQAVRLEHAVRAARDLQAQRVRPVDAQRQRHLRLVSAQVFARLALARAMGAAALQHALPVRGRAGQVLAVQRKLHQRPDRYVQFLHTLSSWGAFQPGTPGISRPRFSHYNIRAIMVPFL